PCRRPETNRRAGGGRIRSAVRVGLGTCSLSIVSGDGPRTEVHGRAHLRPAQVVAQSDRHRLFGDQDQQQKQEQPRRLGQVAAAFFENVGQSGSRRVQSCAGRSRLDVVAGRPLKIALGGGVHVERVGYLLGASGGGGRAFGLRRQLEPIYARRPRFVENERQSI